MSADIEIEDVEDALKRADEYAKLMGRTKKNIVADLLDDGQLNFSAGSDSKSVLDRATDQAKKLQGLLTTLVPIIALLLSIGAEGFGIVDLTGWDFIGDEDKDNDEELVYIYGCMNDKALNYDENATRDDDSCEYAPPPEPDGPGCEPHIYDVQFLYTDSNNDTVKARFDVDCTNSGVTERITVFFSAWMPNTTPDTGDEPVNQTTVWAEVEGTATDYYSVSLGNFEAGVYDLYFILYDANGTVVDGAGEENRWIENPGELAERENERCNVVIDETTWDYTHNTTSLLYQLSCPTEGKNSDEGFYVSVQLGIWENGSDGVGEGNYSDHDTDHYFVEGNDQEPRDLYLDDIPPGDMDMFFIVIWEDENEELFNLVVNVHNRNFG
jgi:hypothetical protein